MKGYDVVESNCQHFCNNVLRKVGLTPGNTTVETLDPTGILSAVTRELN